MQLSRRDFLRATTAAAVTGAGLSCTAADLPASLIIDTHQHLWDLSWQNLPWLAKAPRVLRHNYTTPEYLVATKGLNIRAVYMEVDVAPDQHLDELDHVVTLTRQSNPTTVAAVVGGRPNSPDFAKYVKTLKSAAEVKGVRQVLHGSTGPRHCLSPAFIQGIQLLGEQGLSFDLCMRPKELRDAAELARLCPQTRFIVDHCGNADVKVFNPSLRGDKEPAHDADDWRRGMEELARQPNTICKISGIVASAPAGWKAEHLAPIVNHCLDTFGPERVVFGSDWPVCLLGAPLLDWVRALAEIIKDRPMEHQSQLWSQNAIRLYGLKVIR